MAPSSPPAAALPAGHGAASRWVAYADVVIDTVVQGDGPAIVLLPSMGRDGLGDFDATAARLAAAGFTVLRPQPRGVRGSRGPMVGLGLHSFASDTAEVIRQLAGGRAVVVGHAYGHFIACMTAASHPALVRGVVLAAASARDTAQRFPEVWAAPRVASDTGLAPAARLEALRLGFFSPRSDPAAWLHGWHPAVSAMQQQADLQHSTWWGAGCAPVLEIIPEDDPFKPRDRWGELRDAFGDRVSVATIPDASHALFVEQPGAVADAIGHWARQLPP